MTSQEIVLSPDDEEWSPSIRQQVGAWMTHLVTASSAVWGLLAILAITNERWIESFWWMGAAVFIDSFDGMLARRLQVKRVLPQFDGALLDNIVDYLNYVFVPAYFLWSANVLPPRLAVTGAAMILLASAYQFSQSDAKTDDHYFKGFPSYWNVMVFYFIMLGTSQWVNFGFVVLLTVLVFVPIKYIYPSRTRVQPKVVMVWSILWGISCLAMLLLYPHVPTWIMLFSLTFIVYYHALSLWVQFRPDQ